jgi:hypothetical protein
MQRAQFGRAIADDWIHGQVRRVWPAEKGLKTGGLDVDT